MGSAASQDGAATPIGPRAIEAGPQQLLVAARGFGGVEVTSSDDMHVGRGEV